MHNRGLHPIKANAISRSLIKDYFHILHSAKNCPGERVCLII
jgi:hypothetical protein